MWESLSYLRSWVPIRKAVWPVKPLRVAHPGPNDTEFFEYSQEVGVGKEDLTLDIEKRKAHSDCVCFEDLSLEV